VVVNVRHEKTSGDLMAKLVWTDQFILGVEVIDQQHRTILDYVNQLDDARNNGQTAYSRPNWTRVPRQTGQPFQRKLDTDSTPNWTVIPA
jgi:hypothetical protein